MRKKIGLSLIVATSILVCNSFADTISDKRKAALAALGGSEIKVSEQKVETPSEVPVVNNSDNKSVSLNTKVKETSKNSSEIRKAALEALDTKTNESSTVAENIVENTTIPKSQNISIDNTLVKSLMKRIDELESKVNSQNSERTINEERTTINKNSDFELEKLKKSVQKLEANTANTGGGNNQNVEENISELEEEVNKINKAMKYQLYKISTIEEANTDLEERISLKNEGSSAPMSYNNEKEKSKVVVGNGIVFNGDFDSGYLFENGSDNPEKDGFFLEGSLTASQSLNDNVRWLSKFQLDNEIFESEKGDKSQEEAKNKKLLNKLYGEVKFAESFNLRAGKDSVNTTLNSDDSLEMPNTMNLGKQLYVGKLFPEYSTGASIYGGTKVANFGFDYELGIGNGVEDSVEFNNGKTVNARLRTSLPILDLTRLSFSISNGQDTKNDEVLSEYYDKTVVGFGLELKEGNFKSTFQYLYADYTANEEIASVEDFKRKSFNVTASYTIGDFEPWVMYDYLNEEKVYNVDTVSTTTDLRDANGHLLPAYKGMTDVEDTDRVGLGVKYKYNENVNFNLEEYLTKDEGSTTMLSLNLKF